MQSFFTDYTDFPPEFKEFLENSALPHPPVPQKLLPFLFQTDDNFFGTDEYVPQKNLLFLEDLQDLEQSDEGVNFGLCGTGLQSQYAIYCLRNKNLLFAISLGWNKAYTHPEYEQTDLEQAFQIAQVCILNTPPKGKLTVLINASGCLWQYKNEENYQQGETLVSLLDLIENTQEHTELLPPYMWTRV